MGIVLGYILFYLQPQLDIPWWIWALGIVEVLLEWGKEARDRKNS